MQITLKQDHIEAAIKAYVAKAGMQFPVDQIDFTAGRGKTGLTATIEMADPFSTVGQDEGEDQPAPAPQKAARVNGKAKAEPAPEPQPTQHVETQASEPADQEEPPFTPDENEEGGEAAELPEPPKKASLFG